MRFHVDKGAHSRGFMLPKVTVACYGGFAGREISEEEGGNSLTPSSTVLSCGLVCFRCY